MTKNIIISMLGAALVTRECPWFRICPWDQQASIWLALSVCLLFFCLFLEEQAEKQRKNKARSERMEQMITRISQIRRTS